MEWLSIGCIQGCTHLSKAGLKYYASSVTNDVTVNSLQLQSAAEIKDLASFFFPFCFLVSLCVDTHFAAQIDGVMLQDEFVGIINPTGNYLVEKWMRNCFTELTYILDMQL